LRPGETELMSRKNGCPATCDLTDCAASTLDAAVTAETITSAPRTASAAEPALVTPMAAAASRSRSPSAFGNKTSQAEIVATPVSRQPAAMACPASPKPMNAILGKSDIGKPFDLVANMPARAGRLQRR